MLVTTQTAIAAVGLVSLAAFGFTSFTEGGAVQGVKLQKESPKRKDKIVMTDAQWKRKLPAKAYAILRQEGTEAPYSSALLNVHDAGVFVCAGCGLPLYRTADKFDSGTGWPSFVKPIVKSAVWYKGDGSLGMDRDEVLCARCDGHLGHVFDDGPKDRGGLRYCMDGDALVFQRGKK